MEETTGIIKVIQVDEDGEKSAIIETPSPVIPTPGRYIVGYNPWDQNEVLGSPLFQVSIPKLLNENQKPKVGPIPPSWVPGTRIMIFGPLGNGFHIQSEVRHLMLVSITGSIAKLLPLIEPVIASNGDIAIFTPSPLNKDFLHPSIEIHPLHELSENLSWPTFIAIDAPLSEVKNLRKIFGLDHNEKLPCTAQILIRTPMPCCGIGKCGACAVQTEKSGYKFCCDDGPVFDINELF